jgi:DNA polymerase III epsilon subunit-like protein
MLEFVCPHCNTTLNIPPEFIGTEGTCRKCDRKIFIEQQSTHDSDLDDVSYTDRAPILAAFHCETTGTSSRKSNITELGAIKFNMLGEEVDRFWSFANPGHMILPKISERTGITDEAVAGAPPSIEVVKRFFQWLGTHTLLFSHHAQFCSKFVAGTLLKNEVEPPNHIDVIDITQWGRELRLPVKEYKLRTMMEHFGHRNRKAHRALAACHGIVSVTHDLAKTQAGAHIEVDDRHVMSKLMGRKVEAINEEVAFREMALLSKTLEQTCGDGFYDKIRNDHRRARSKPQRINPGNGGATMPEFEYIGLNHESAWYSERKRHILRCKYDDTLDTTEFVEDIPANPPWEFVILEATQIPDKNEQKQLCEKAIHMGARDPWPFVCITAYHLNQKHYDSAQGICEEYFETDLWKNPKWADSSLKLFDKLEKLGRRKVKSD